MNIDFKPADKVEIDRKIFVVQPDPEMPKRPYVELGGSGRVIQLTLSGTKEYHALKVFNHPQTTLVNKTEILKRYKVFELPGLAVAQRSVINPGIDSYKELIQKYPYLKYSVLMPWIGGYTWFEILGDNKGEGKIPAFNRKTSLYYASQLANILASLESRGYAHCDICNNNIILDFKNQAVQLIDIEDMYLPGVKKSGDFIGGQDGYAHPKRLQGHQWIKEGDRFGGGMLISEILAWSDPQIRKESDSESYAVPSELCQANKKYDLMKGALSGYGNGRDGVASLFEKLWHSESLESCPPLSEWKKKVDQVVDREGVREPALDGLSQLGADGRIKRQNNRISLNEKQEKLSSVSSTRKKANKPSSQEVSSLPSFQPSNSNPLSTLLYPDPPIVVSNVSIVHDSRKIKVSVSYPISLSKRFESVFLCQIYWSENRSKVLKNIRMEFKGEKFKEKNQISYIKPDQKITIKLSSQNFSFSEPITKTMNDSIIKIHFLGKPNDNCEPGFHKIKVSFLDAETDEELDYLTIENVKVVDFAFDHISRPLLSRISTTILGIGSFIMFLLSLSEQIDKTIGLTSGTAAGVLAAVLYLNFHNLYQRIRLNIP